MHSDLKVCNPILTLVLVATNKNLDLPDYKYSLTVYLAPFIASLRNAQLPAKRRQRWGNLREWNTWLTALSITKRYQWPPELSVLAQTFLKILPFLEFVDRLHTHFIVTKYY